MLRVCHAEGVPVVPRGSGTSLAGGALPTADCVLLGVARLTAGAGDRLREPLHPRRRPAAPTSASPPPSRTRASSTPPTRRASSPAPSPATSRMNSGGAHCLKYGVTTNNLLGVTMVLMDGTVVELGGAHLDAPGLDLLGVVCGSEGQLGVVTEATLAHPAQARGRPPGAHGLRLERGRRAPASPTSSAPASCRSRSSSWTAPASAPARPSPMPAIPTSRRCSSSRSRAPRPRSPSSSDKIIAIARAPRPRGDPREPLRRGVGADLEGPQGRLRRDGPDRRLHLPRRHDPGQRAAFRPPPHRRAHRGLRPRASPTSSTPATATCTR